MMLRGIIAAAAVLLLPAPPGTAAPAGGRQEVLRFEAVSSGFILPPQRSVTVDLPGEWRVKPGAGPANMLSIGPMKGSGPSVLKVVLNGWWAVQQAPGGYEQTLSIESASGTRTVAVAVTVHAAAPQPRFTYPAGPQGCSSVTGLPDAAVCVAPGEKPPGNFQPPAAGKSYADPNFGGMVTVLTAPQSLHGYSSPSAISATGRHVLIGTPDAAFMLDVATGRAVRQPAGTSFEGAIWDAVQDDTGYHAGRTPLGRAVLVRQNFATGARKVVADYSKAPYGFSAISTGATGEGSKDNWISFFAAAERRVCALSLDAKRTYCAEYGTLAGGPYNVDFCTISKGIDSASGKRYVVLVGAPALLVFSVNEAQGRLDFEFRGPDRVGFGRNDGDGVCGPGEACVTGSHSDLFEDSRGNQLMMTAEEYQNPCEFDLVSYQLNKGARMAVPVEMGGGMRRIMTLFRCGGEDVWADYHIGCARATPYCVVSTTYGGYQSARQPDDSSPMRRAAHLAEIFVVRDNGAEVRRLARHRSVSFATEDGRGYWSTPRACIAPDGSYVVADSNFGTPQAQRVIRVDTGFGSTRSTAPRGAMPPPAGGRP